MGAVIYLGQSSPKLGFQAIIFDTDWDGSSQQLNKNDLFSNVDQIAIPDFSAGAMENWGLITYRETALLYDEAFSSNSNKERIASIIAHELAHMVRFNYWALSAAELLYSFSVIAFSPLPWSVLLVVW